MLVEEVQRDGWHIGGQPFFGPPTLMGALGRSKAAYEAIDGTPTTPGGIHLADCISGCS